MNIKRVLISAGIAGTIALTGACTPSSETGANGGSNIADVIACGPEAKTALGGTIPLGESPMANELIPIILRDDPETAAKFAGAIEPMRAISAGVSDPDMEYSYSELADSMEEGDYVAAGFDAKRILRLCEDVS